MAFERDGRPADCAAFGALCEAVMQRYGLAASDKDIARWVESELRQLSPARPPTSTSHHRRSRRRAHVGGPRVTGTAAVRVSGV